MIDVYLKARNQADMALALVSFEGDHLSLRYNNVIGPSKGQLASVGDNGEVIPARGDPDYWYTCIRLEETIVAPEETDLSVFVANLLALNSNVEVVDEKEGLEVCGKWA